MCKPKLAIKTPTTLIEQGIFVVPPEADDIQPGEPRVFNILMDWDCFNTPNSFSGHDPEELGQIWARTDWVWRIEATNLEEIQAYFDSVTSRDGELIDIFSYRYRGEDAARLSHPSKYLKRGTWVQYDRDDGWINWKKIDGRGSVDELDCYLCANDAWTM